MDSDARHEPPQPEPPAPEEALPASGRSLIEAQSLVFTYRDAESPALRGIDFRQERGEFLVLMGGSGAGKSTFCRCLNGLIPRHQPGEMTGALMVCGQPVSGRSPHELARQVGLVFQDFEAQLFCTSAELELAFGPENLQVAPEEIRERISQLLPFLGLEGLGRREPASLSGGEKQRLALGAVLAMSPELLVLDEPTTDLDPAGKDSIYDIAAGLRQTGMGILLVDHETEQALEADLVVLLAEGRLRAAGPPRRVLSRTDLLTHAGVRPLELFHAFARLGDSNPPFTVQEAKQRVLDNGWYLDLERHAQLVRGDETRRESYGDELISIEGLYHQYERPHMAVDNVSLEIRKGEFVALVGQNGCGKTTLVKHLNGLLEPTSGVVRIYGKPTTEHTLAQLGRRVGYVFQNPDHQIFADTVSDEVAFAPRNQDLDEQQVVKRVAEALTAVEMAGAEKADPFSLTKGERQRVAVASVLAARPEILLFDEPTTGLDHRQQCQMMDLVRKLNEEHGHTIVMITHSMWAVTHYAHRCLIMHNGKILRDASVREVFSQAELLAEASLSQTPLAQFTAEMGATVLTVEELEQCLIPGEER